MMKLIRQKDAAGRLPEKENRRSSLRGILGLALLALGVLLMAGGLRTRTYTQERRYDTAYTVDDMVITASHGEDDQISEEETNTDTETQTNTGRKITFTADMKKDPSYEVTFVSNSSGVRKIAETEKPYDPDDLEGRITHMELQRKNPETGEWENIPDGEAVVLGNNYKLTVHFEGGTEGFENPMKWNLGENVKCEPKQGAPIWDNGTQIGTYDLTEDGQVTVYLDPSYLQNENQVLDMEFNMVPTKSAGDTDKDFPWSGHIEQHNVVKNAGDLAVQKDAGYYSSSGSINYTVEASVTEGMVTNGKLVDTMEDGLTFLGIKSMKVFDSEGRDVTDRYKESIDKLMEEAKKQVGNNQWTLEPLPPLSKGMRFVVEYQGLVDEDNQKNKEYVAKNTVTFDGTKPDGEPAEKKKDEAEKSIAKDQITKSGNTTLIEENGKEKEVIEWEVRIGSGQWDPLAQDLTIEDTLGEGLSFRKNEPFVVEWRDKEGNVKGTFEIPWGDNIELSDSGKVATYKLYAELFKDYDWQDGDYLQVTYKTDFDPEKQPTTGFENTVKNDILGQEGTTGVLPVGESVQKTVVNHKEENYLAYTVVVDVPPCGHMKSMKDDTSDGHPELDLPYFYIEDRLDFGDDYFAYNVPENVTVYAQGKNAPYKEYTFTNVPYTSGGGSSNEGETFQILQGPESHNKVEGKNWRAFRIYFNTARYGLGTEGELERHDSIWDIDEATQLTITYEIPYNTMVVDADGKDTGMTVGELLNQEGKLENKALSERSGVERSGNCFVESHPQVGDLEKLARYVSDGVVEYRVSFVNSNDEGGRLITKDPTDTKRYFGNFNPRPTLIDTFDPCMEYVEGSLYLEVRSKNSGNLYATYEYTGEYTGKYDPVEGNTLSAEVLDFTKQTWNDGSSDDYHYYKDQSIENVFNTARTLVFVYQLRLKDEYRESWEPVKDIKNDAIFRYGETDKNASTNIDIPSDMLQKDFTTTDNGTLLYTLNVNPQAANLVQLENEEEYVNPNSFKLVDEMSDNLELVTDQNNDYKITVEYEEKNTDGNEVWKPLTRSTSPQGINRDSLNYYRDVGEGNIIYFILPDELHIRITYEVRVNGPGSAGSQAFVENTATLYADEKETDERNTIAVVGDSSASGHSDPKVRLQKEDSKTGEFLVGAGFTLYCSDKNAEGVDRNEFIEVTKDEKKIKLYKVKTYTTDEDGEIKKIPRPKGANVSDAFYALVETTVPEGYSILPEDEIRFFSFPNYGGPVESGTVTYNENIYEIQPMEANETITVYNTPDEYVLPETGGPGTAYLYLLGSLLMAAGGLLLLNERRLARRK